ncbi:hypothetical protein BB560_007036 [Smittium megazygosporum]|uniref:H/ACA ribonucleoprotein complex non-core subunit NAF1 n=1 Tax=Smittium megazygosporum TaxID=133381 RepID=A0A2T9XZA5_9FUNG|nr:hypothetical protein BB560_007036 [Smittium megazygosporum]
MDIDPVQNENSTFSNNIESELPSSIQPELPSTLTHKVFVPNPLQFPQFPKIPDTQESFYSIPSPQQANTYQNILINQNLDSVSQTASISIPPTSESVESSIFPQNNNFQQYTNTRANNTFINDSKQNISTNQVDEVTVSNNNFTIQTDIVEQPSVIESSLKVELEYTFNPQTDSNEMKIETFTQNEIVPPNSSSKINDSSSDSDDTDIDYSSDSSSQSDLEMDIMQIRGIISGEQKVLDYGSVLVFQDRSVLGPVFETFGPIRCPSYSILFPFDSSIDKSKVIVGNKVFAVNEKSIFSLTSSLNTKGSDASNLNDEEVDDSEIEFSDDDQERKFRSWLKSRRLSKKSNNNNHKHSNYQHQHQHQNPNNSRQNNNHSQNENIILSNKKVLNYFDTPFDPDLGF